MARINKALINYYARLVKKGNMKIEEIPEDKVDMVKEALEKLPDPVFDPVTQTPEEK